MAHALAKARQDVKLLQHRFDHVLAGLGMVASATTWYSVTASASVRALGSLAGAHHLVREAGEEDGVARLVDLVACQHPAMSHPGLRRRVRS